MISQHAVELALLCCTIGCSRPQTDMRPTEPEAGAPSPSSSSIPVPAVSAANLESANAPRDAGSECRKLPLLVGGTLARQSFEGPIAVVTGHDPEQGDGNFPVLVLDVPVCGEYQLAPQQELLVGVLGGKVKWEALGRQWAGQRVRVVGDVRSLDIYLRPLRHFLLFASHVEALP